MKYFLIFSLIVTPAFAADKLGDFNKKLLENFEKDIRTDNDVSVKKNQGPTRGPASVAPENQNSEVEKKIDKNVRQTGHQDW